MDIEFFFQFGSNVGPEALDTFVPVNGDFWVNLVDHQQELYSLHSDLVVAVEQRSFNQQVQYLRHVYFSLLKIELLH